MIPRLVSCIVPVYDGERYLREALDSIASQTYRLIEIIVVDDGSNDGSARIAGEFPTPIRFLQQSNAGPAAARNSGIRVARGEFVAFLDADDLWYPDKLSKQVTLLRERDDLGFCVTLIQNFWMPEVHMEKERLEGSRLAEPLPGYNAPTLLVRAKSLQRVGEFSEAMAHTSEPDWFLRAREVGVAGELLNEVLVERRLHLFNRSRLRKSSSSQEYLRYLKARLDLQRRIDH
jgi:glycosyltransferase involved in cell wall biosynthesis